MDRAIWLIPREIPIKYRRMAVSAEKGKGLYHFGFLRGRRRLSPADWLLPREKAIGDSHKASSVGEGNWRTPFALAGQRSGKSLGMSFSQCSIPAGVSR